MVGSVNDWQKERQFQVLNEKKEERGVKVIRDGVEKIVDVKVCFLSFTTQLLNPAYYCYCIYQGCCGWRHSIVRTR